MNKNARQNVEDTVNSLRQVKQYLTDAANTVENSGTKTRIQSQISSIQNCLNECESIASGLSQR